MSLVISNNIDETYLLNQIEALSEIDIRSCLQCKKCSNGCSVKSLTKVSPSEIIRKIQLNAKEDLFSSDLIWMCASCETCYSRCPMKINIASVIDSVRVLSVKRNDKKPKGNIPLFNKAFLKTVKMFGRTYDIGMIALYKLGTSTYLKDTDKFPMMLKKGKIALFPSFKADKKYTKRIFKKTSKKNI